MQPGQTFAHYTVSEKIGAGGMGEVFRATDTRLNRDVALKVLPDFFADDPERLARFRREAQVLASLNHPGIAAIHGLESAGGAHALAMELVEGQDLTVRLKAGPLSVDESLRLALQLAEAVEAAHEAGIVHRDLKPANIKINPDGRVKVLDFGLAKALADDPSESSVDPAMSPTLTANMTAANVILGTAAYMSPEQARGTAVDKRADIWSFGVVLAEMLCGRRIFTGETVSDTLASVLKSGIELDDLPEDLPRAVRRLLDRCLQRDPRQRLRDMGDARIVLQEVVAGGGDDETRPAESAARSNPLLRIVALAVVAALAAGATYVLTRQPAAELPLRKSTIVMRQDDPSRQIGYAPMISPDGRQVLYISDGSVWLRDLAATQSRLLAGTEDARIAFWSPDAAWIGFATQNAFKKVERGGGQPTVIAGLSGSQTLGNAARAAWGEDGTIVYGTGSTGLFKVPSHGGTVSEFVAPDEGATDIHEVCGLPGDRGWVYVLHDDKGYGILVLLTPDGARRELLRIDGESFNDPVYAPAGHIVFTRGDPVPGIWALPFSLDDLQVTGEPFLIAGGGKHPSVAADGTLVYVANLGSQNSELVWIERDGTVSEVIAEVETTRPFPDLAPDGRRVALSVLTDDKREVWVYDSATGDEQRLTFDGRNYGITAWHPDGHSLFTYTEPDFTGYLIHLDGTPSRRLWRGIVARFTPDGRHLLYGKPADQGFAFNIARQPLAESDGAEDVIVEHGDIAWDPNVSPDGRFIAYTSNASGYDEVYATTYPDATGRWQVSRGGGSWVRWRADGKELYYTTRDKIMAVEVSTGDGLSLGRPRELFTRPTIDWNPTWNDGYAVTPDGRRFVMLRPRLDEGPPPELVVVQNWAAEFSKK